MPRLTPIRRKEGGFNLGRMSAANGRWGKPVDLRKGARIFSHGDPAKHVYYIERGSVKIHFNSKSGEYGVIGLLGVGEFFGDGGLIGAKSRVYCASANTDCRVIRFDSRWMAQTLQSDRAFSNFFISYLLARIDHVVADLADQLVNPSEKRLARVLLIMAQLNGTGKAEETQLPKITHETLAAMVGTTRSRVNHFMNKFRRLGYIRYDGGLEISNSLVNILLQD